MGPRVRRLGCNVLTAGMAICVFGAPAPAGAVDGPVDPSIASPEKTKEDPVAEVLIGEVDVGIFAERRADRGAEDRAIDSTNDKASIRFRIIWRIN